MEKFIFGMETLSVSQNYNSTFSHSTHSTGRPADYPVDICGIDGGQSAYIAKNDMVVVTIMGEHDRNITNCIQLRTKNKVKTPAFEDYAYVSLSHWNDGTMKWKVGDVIKAGEIITYEGTDYPATGNHFHAVYGRGTPTGFTKNNKGAWVVTGNNYKPEDVVYILDGFTKVQSTGGINWKHTNSKNEEVVTEKIPYQKGMYGPTIYKIDDWFYKKFKGNKAYKGIDFSKLRGNYFGDTTYATVKRFQERATIDGTYHDACDGIIGLKTLECMRKYGYKG